MAFQLRDFPTIVASMVSEITALNSLVTDMTEGSVVRSLVETVAQEIQKLEFAAFQGITEGINVGTYKNFNFSALPATYASGIVQFQSSSPQTQNNIIPAGSNVGVPGTNLVYTVNANTVFPGASTSVNVLCTATTAGSVGNTPANTITSILSGGLSFVNSITNPSAFINGTDSETTSARAARFANYLAGLSMGTVSAIQSGAESVFLTDSNGNITERVVNALVVEGFLQDPTQPLGLVQVYIDNGGGTASNALIQQTQQVLLGYTDTNGNYHPGFFAAGVQCYVYAVVAAPLAITATVHTLPGFNNGTTTTAVQNAITSYLQQLTVGETAVLSEITYAALGVTGVTDIAYLTPLANVTPISGQRVTPGAITLTAVTP